jgi:hypothetical protein
MRSTAVESGTSWPGPDREGESRMKTHSLIAVVVAVALAGCGSTKTVTLTSFRSTPSPASSVGAGAGSSSGGTGGTASAVAACFRLAGAGVNGPRAAGRGLADYVRTRDGGNLGFVKAADVPTITAIAKVFTLAGDHITVLRKDPTAFVFYKGSLTKNDSDLLRNCSTHR